MNRNKNLLIETITAAVLHLPPELRERFDGTVEILPTARPEFGDFAANIAFKLAGKNAKPPVIAERLAAEIAGDLPPFLAKIEVKNCFINFFLKQESALDVVRQILSQGERFGFPTAGDGQKVLIEFVSANPTGPLTIAHGRQAAFGEALARILSFAGRAVTKEYYLNDGGRQISLLGKSLEARWLQQQGKDAAIPEDGYQGEYLNDIARMIKEPSTDPDFFMHFAVREILADIKKDLKDFGVSFDSWVEERRFHESGRVADVFALLRKKDLLYEKDGSTWFASSRFGDEKDRVVVKSDGSTTYLAPDMAYHRDKMERGFSILINLWGPDHHGYIARLKAAIEALGFDPAGFSVMIVQLTTLYRGEEKLRMSTRAGEFVTLRQLMDEVGPDAAKFFFLFRRAESHLDFDLEVAKKQSLENPVYYLQYAYVRLLHVLHYAEEQGKTAERLAAADLSLLTEPPELEIAKKLARFPELVEQIATGYDVHLLAEYLIELAQQFHSYYAKCRIVSGDARLTESRLALTQAVRRIFSTALTLLNISLPDKM